MRVLFVSGSPGGGSLRSTVELAHRFERRGHDVALLHATGGGAFVVRIHKRAVNLRTTLEPRSGARVIGSVARGAGRRLRPGRAGSGFVQWSAVLPENALGGALRRFRPDVVVVSSISRTAWRQIRAELGHARVASVLYLREESSLGHLQVSEAPADLHLANADIHTARLAEMGYDCTTVPSMIELDRCRVESSRKRVLFVNPIAISGLAIAIAIARAMPEMLFAFAESWKLESGERVALETQLAGLGNVELRARVDDPRRVYSDARVLLAPYLTNGRPRVVLEAQANGIPVLGSDIPALREAVGEGGILIDPEAPVDAWVEALNTMLEPTRYERLVDAARAHAARDEVDPETILDRFERALERLLAGREAVNGSAGE